jgi:hypothetical protein
MAILNRCPKCNCEVFVEDNFCQECGNALPKPSYAYAPPPVPRPGLDLSIGILVVAFFGLLVWWLVDAERSRSPFSTKEAVIQARAAIAATEYDKAIQILDAVSIKESGKTNANQRAALNDALYMRALNSAQAKNYRLALSDLLRISPEYPEYTQARQKIHEYIALSEEKPADVLKVGKRTGRNRTVAPAVAASALEEVAESADREVTRTIKKTKEGVTITTSRPNYTDKDVARFNQLLADYFSEERMATRRSIKDGLGVEGKNQDPPSFKEWINQGRPDF